MRRLLVTALAATLLAATPALAAPPDGHGPPVALAASMRGRAALVPPSPGHVASAPLGRVEAVFNHGGNPATGSVVCSAQGNRIDGPDANNQAEALRGRIACLERNNVVRVRLHFIALLVFRAGAWQVVARDDQDVVSSAEPAHAINFTPVPGFCPGNLSMRSYRVVGAAGFRWTDGQASNVTFSSNTFDARVTVNQGIC